MNTGPARYRQRRSDYPRRMSTAREFLTRSGFTWCLTPPAWACLAATLIAAGWPGHAGGVGRSWST